MPDPSPIEIAEQIEQDTFSIDQVASALSVKPILIMNYQQKNGLDLCSASPGRGSPRIFCLMDVYMLALLREILLITGNANLAARDINRLVFSDHPDPPLPPSRRASRKKALREDIGIAHELFSYRHPVQVDHTRHYGNDWFLLTSDIEAGFRTRQFDGSMMRSAGGAWINTTMALTRLDRRLFIISKAELADV